jgi:hypothetical protein
MRVIACNRQSANSSPYRRITALIVDGGALVSEEKLSLQELEVRLKEQELKLREAEVLAKTRDLTTSKWSNPVVGLFAAALGLAGNVVVTTITNTNTQKLERSRTQSTLMLEAIKTNGDTNAACKNLIFFLSLGLIEDTNKAITGACPGNIQGVGWVSRTGPPDVMGGTLFYPLIVQTVDDKGAPIPDVSVEANLVPSSPSLEIPSDLDARGYTWLSHQTSTRCVTSKDGTCVLGMAPSGRFVVILAKKDGYVLNRTNALFKDESVVVLLEKNPATH